jgi:hypothetical protein
MTYRPTPEGLARDLRSLLIVLRRALAYLDSVGRRA